MREAAQAESTGEVPVVLGRSGPPGVLSYSEARQVPCFECQSSPCCTYLLLRDFQLETLLDVDYALFLLNFDGIYLGLMPDRKVDVYLYQACGHLDVGSGLCRVHTTPAQPAVCIHYSAHSCGYRFRMQADVDQQRPVLDRTRMQWLAEHLVYDEERRIIGGAEWADILEAFTSMPLDRRPAPIPPPDPVVAEWQEIVLSGAPPAGRPTHRFSDPQVSDPCSACGAYCCNKLVFNRGVPQNYSQLEFLRYCLGFPSVEVGVAADGWAVIVNTTCRHLDGNRCGVFGQEERPLRCHYYDALSCGYRSHFGDPRPEEMVRIQLGQFGLVADSLVYDDLGQIVAIPPVEVLRGRLESALRVQAAAAAQGVPAAPLAAEAVTHDG